MTRQLTSPDGLAYYQASDTPDGAAQGQDLANTTQAALVDVRADLTAAVNRGIMQRAALGADTALGSANQQLTLASTTLTVAANEPVFIIAMVLLSTNGVDQTGTLYIKRDTTTLTSHPFTMKNLLAGQVMQESENWADTPGAGTFVYSVVASGSAGVKGHTTSSITVVRLGRA